MAMTNSETCRAYRQRLRTRALNLIGRDCVFCGSAFNVHATHVRSTGLDGESRGMDRRYLDIIKHPSHYRPMCRHCHGIFDSITRHIEPTVPEEPLPF